MPGDYNLGTARGKLEIDASQAETGAKKGTKAVEGFTGKLTSSGQALAGVGAGIGGVGAAIGVAFVGAINQAANFEKQMSAIQAVSGATVPEMDSVRKKALQLGADTAFSAGEAGQAMEELIKAGISIPDVLNGAADATVALAAAGEIALPEAAAIASNAMNQFSLSAQEMPKIADLIAGAANASAIDVGDFGQSLSQVGAVANLAGLSFQDTAVAIAEMGNAGIKGSDAGTSLKTMLTNLQPQTDKAAGLMKELGLMTEDGANKFYDAQGKLKSLAEIQQLLQTATKDLTAEQKQQALGTLFGSDAIRAAAVLTKNGAKGYNDMAGAMGKVTAEQVALSRQNNFQGDLEKLKGSLDTVAIQVGTIFLPALRALVQWLGKVVDWFSNLSDGTRKTIVIIAGILAAVLLIVGAFIAFAGAIGILLGALAPLAAAIGIGAAALLGWVVIIPIIIAAVVALVVIIIKNWDKIKNFTIAVWNAIVNFLKTVWSGIASFFSSIGASIAGFFTGLWNGIKNVAMTVWNGIVAFFTAIFNTIVAIITTYVNIWRTIITTVLNAIKAVWEAIWGTFGGLITAVFNLIKAALDLGMRLAMLAVLGPLKIIYGYFKTQFFAARDLTTQVFNAVRTFLVGVFNAIANFIGPKVAAVRNAVQAAWNAIRNTTTSVFNAIAGFVSGVWNSIVSRVTGPVNTIKSAVSTGFNAAKSAATAAFNSLRDAVGRAIDSAYTKVSGVVSRIRGIFAGAAGWLVNAGRNIIQGLIDGITSKINVVTEKLKSLTNLIPKVKGPERVDKKLLQPAGEWIMEGFIGALQAGVAGVRRTLGGLTGELPTLVPVYADLVGDAGGPSRPVPPTPPANGGSGNSIYLTSINPVGKSDVETLSDEVTRLAELGVL